MRRLALFIFLLLPGISFAQVGVGAYYPSGPYLGFWTGPAFGYWPGDYQGFYSNGYSRYGPPVPTYGTVPGFFGGADQRLNTNPDPRYYGYGAYPYRGVVIPLNPPRPIFVRRSGPAICEVRLPAADAELYVNGEKFEGTGTVREIHSALHPRLGTTWELKASWSTPNSIGSATRTAVLRAGEITVVDFTSAGDAANKAPGRFPPIETIPAPAPAKP